ncbi:MAG: hypothetical protein WBE34_09465, partial [Candidatus Nitrosopolaris sp.]
LFEIGGKVGVYFLVFISSLYYPVYLEFNRYGVNLHTVNNISKDWGNMSKRDLHSASEMRMISIFELILYVDDQHRSCISCYFVIYERGAAERI